MKDWIIDGGTLFLGLNDGFRYRPMSRDIYGQIDNEFFAYKGKRYAPLSQTDLRFSNLTAPFKAEFSLNDVLVLDLFSLKGERRTNVGKYEKQFNDYIISDGVWKYLGPVVESVNSIMADNSIDPSNVTYQQYVFLLKELNNAGIEVVDSVATAVREIQESTSFSSSTGLKADLYPYQSGGVEWLDFMVRHQCGVILGDEMGLGKTLQIIAIMGLQKERKPSSRFLVICPVSLLENWRREIARFYPSLTVNIHYGSNRTGNYVELYKYDVNLMTYNCAVLDSGLLSMTRWDMLIIDEAQNIKNPDAKRTKAVKRINSTVPIAVTGTPFENHMTDVWSIVDFILPGFLGSRYQFENSFGDDVYSALSLEKLITPVLLRRRVKDVAKDLPERIDIPQPIIMSESEARLYEDSRLAEEPYDELKSLQLAKIQKLRMFCTHPCVYDDDYSEADPTIISTKYLRLCEILEEVFELNEKVVIFTSFRRMIDLLCQDIAARFGVFTSFIDGTVFAGERQAIVDEFTNLEGPGALVLNPRAAGVGLNITCANHVIHYNLEWNPAVEDQASARVYRRGQEKNVFIHRLYYANTLEEIINDRIQSKRLLSDSAIVGNDGTVTEQEYLIRALAASPFNKCLYEKV